MTIGAKSEFLGFEAIFKNSLIIYVTEIGIEMIRINNFGWYRNELFS